MPTAPDSPSNHHSPRAGGGGGGAASSPRFRHNCLPSPWAQVVRGEQPPPPPPAPADQSPSPPPPPAAAEQPQRRQQPPHSPPKPAPAAAPDDPAAEAEGCDVNGGNAGPSRPSKPAWKMPAPSDVVEAGPVMGDSVAWPALSESARAPVKSLSVESTPKAVNNGSASSSQGPIIPNLPERQGSSSNGSPRTTPNRTQQVRRRPNRRGDGTGASNGSGSWRPQTGFAPPPPSQPLPRPVPMFQMSPNPYGNFVRPAPPDFSNGEPPYRGNNWDSRPTGGLPSRPQLMNGHPESSQRVHSSRNNYGNRRDHDRGNYPSQQHSGAPRGFGRLSPPPVNSMVYMGPQPMRPFGMPMGYAEMPSQYYSPALHVDPYTGWQYVVHTPTAHMFTPMAVPDNTLPVSAPESNVPAAGHENTLPASLVDQIEYYFSDDNLVKDVFLRSNMDEEGWVSIEIIAKFRRVQEMTRDVKLILDSLKASRIVEVWDRKVRRRGDWKKFFRIDEPNKQVAIENDSPSPSGFVHNKLATTLEKFTMEEAVAETDNNVTGEADLHSEDVSGRNSSERTGTLKLPNGEVTEQYSSSSKN
ncbi:la-related protein 1B-like isoform X2 [Rhodamnia argentea]|uniref:La-related protein 1B-like isoform X2 n=1 Tax=Rhodamnia argentea TaxID=178133 RepID=A0ABM3H1G7_9MYRT|nr:la-related protein 1B-like isoform X2 [Rhodamnia argentea]